MEPNLSAVPASPARRSIALLYCMSFLQGKMCIRDRRGPKQEDGQDDYVAFKGGDGHD